MCHLVGRLGVHLKEGSSNLDYAILILVGVKVSDFITPSYRNFLKLKHFLGDANPLKLIEEKNVALKKTQERVDALLEEFNELKVHAKESKAYAQ